MPDLSWISQEAKELHAIFEQVFYSLTIVLLLLGVVMEYFKLPIGGTPQFSALVGRCLVAAILLASYPEVSNLIADVTDSLADRIGSLDSIHLVLGRYWDQLSHFQMSWTSIKDSVLMLVSFVTFFLLYISVYLADAAITYAWVLLYVFSPLLIALYVLPTTSGATKALYRTLFEVGAWKVVWAVLATLLWSSALSQINQPQNNVNFITAISFNLILAGSLLLTPFVVSALAGAGLASLAAQTAGIAAGAAMFSPGQLLTQHAKKQVGKRTGGDLGGGGSPGPGPSSQFHERYGNCDEGSASPLGGRRPSGQVSKPAHRETAQPQARASSPSMSPKPRVMQSRPQDKGKNDVSFKSAVSRYEPPPNRSSFQRQPMQRALFRESQKQDSSKPPKGV